MWKALLPLGLLVVAVLALVRRGGDDWEYEQAEPATDDAPTAPHAARRRPAARFALVAAFTTLFFAGASFTAGAGDQTARLLEKTRAVPTRRCRAEVAAGRQAVPADAQPVEAAPAEAAPAAAPAELLRCRARSRPSRPSPPSAAPVAAAPRSAAAEQPTRRSSRRPFLAAQAPRAASSPPLPPSRPEGRELCSGDRPAPAAKPAAPRQPTKQWVVKRAGVTPAVEPEIEHEHGEPTIWLNRALPDPTPASARLARSFARDLVAVSKRHGADWAAVLGVLRAQGSVAQCLRPTAELDTLASRLAHKNAWKGALAVSGRTTFADRAEALADLYRSVGIEALVIGFEAAKDRLTDRLLADEDVWIYDSGREDLAAGRIDVRVIVLLGYLVERHESIDRDEPLLGPPQVRAGRSRLGPHVRARSRHRRRRRALDRGQPAARRHHRGSCPLGAAPPRRAPAAASDLAARTGRALVPASRSWRPHPRWLLGQRAFSARTGASSASICS